MKLEPWLKKRVKKRKDGRLEMKLSDMPAFPDSIDKLPNPVEIDGRRKMWVGIGWIDEGEAKGDEPLVILTEEDDDA